jgi:DNA-binding transcriptional regulator YbjK
MELLLLLLYQQQHRAQVQQRRQQQQQQQQQEQQQAAAARLDAVKQQAVARFWELLQDFVALHVAPDTWLPELAPDHPFLRVDGDRLVVHRVAPAPGAE